MNIALITITYNDDLRLNQWKDLYQRYNKDINYHIIVDNNSNHKYKNELKKAFPDSIIIERTTNGGCTAAYNDGIKYALDSTDCDAIGIICNDTKVELDFYPVLYDYLYSDDELGMVSPATLIKDTDVVNNFGHSVTNHLTMKNNYHGKKINDLKNNEYSEMLLGGNNLAKRSFYKKIGLQDENLFMYSDELDTAFRAKKAKIKLGVTSKTTSMHYHIPYLNKLDKPYFCYYLMQRNKVYLAHKHFDMFKVLQVFLTFLFLDIGFIIKSLLTRNSEKFHATLWGLLGLINGLLKNMKSNKYSQPK